MKPILEPIHLGDQRTIVSFRHCKENFETPWHFHPQHELTYIEESVGTKFIGDFVGSYQPGELVLLRSNLPHCWKNVVQVGHQSKSVVVQWNKGTFMNVPELAALFDLLRKASKGIIFDKTDTVALYESLKILPDLEGHILYMHLLALLMELSKCRYTTLSAASFIDDLPSEYESRMVKIHEFVGANFGQKVYLNEVADLINLSEQSFSRFFTKMMGRSFFVFLNEYRINMASRMLLDTDGSVAQIGFNCGYESLQFFHKKFQEIHGITPMKYRKKYAISAL